MMRRYSLIVAAALATLLVTACRPDRATAPDPLLASFTAGSPSPLNAYAASVSQISLDWQDNAPNETGFEVQRAPSANGTFVLIHTTGAGITYFADVTVTPHSTWCYRVRAVRAKGKPTYSAFSNTACATTPGPPSAPESIDAVLVDYASINTTWSAAAAATGYHVERSPTPGGTWVRLATVAAQPTSYRDNGRPAEEQACYRAIAYNVHGEAISPVDCTTPPARPSNLIASTPEGGGVGLTWDDNSAVEDGYDVQRAPGNWEFTTIATAAANVESYHDASPTPDVRYQYRVRAKKDAGFSLTSNVVEAIIVTTVPAAPTGVRALAYSSTQIHVSWDDVSANETGFRVERSATGSAPWSTVGTTGRDATGQSDYAAIPDEEACYRVFAFNGFGDSPASPTDCTTAPKGPTNLTAEGSVSGAIDLTWTDVSSVEDGYEIQQVFCYEYYYGQWYCYPQPIMSVGAGATSARITGLGSGEWITFQVLAFKTKGESRSYSDPSNQASGMAPP